MKKLGFVLISMVVAFATGTAFAQGRGSSHWGGGSMGGSGGGYSGGGSMGGGGGGYSGGGYRGGYSGAGYHGGYSGGGYYGGGYRGGYYAARYGGYYGGWRGYGWYGPSVGLYFGAPYFWGAWPYSYGASYPAYYPYVDSSATDGGVYSQAMPASPSAVPANQYWYYCTDPAGYYPYVQNCTKAWMQVVPQFDPRAPALAPTQ